MTPETSSPTDETIAPAMTDFRRLLLSLVLVFGFLIVILGGFYLEENWRGKHGWEKTKERLAARGEKLEWSDYLRTPPPDESNMMKAPLMEAMLVRGQTGALTIGTIPAGVLDRSGKVINWLPGERP